MKLRIMLLLTVVTCLLTVPTQSNAQNALPPHGLTLDEIRAAYGLDKLMQAGEDGTGQTVAIITQGGFKASDITTFASQWNLPPAQITSVLVGNNDGQPNGGSLEWTMDTEIVYAIAPKATILVFEGSSYFAQQTISGKVPSVFDAILRDGRANVVGFSYDTCELNFGKDDAQKVIDETQKLHDAGITMFHGAGDYGAYRCAETGVLNANMLSVGLTAADPYVAVLGGTRLTMTDGHYGSEVVWVNLNKHSGTGGGLSSLWPIPDYQKPYQLKDENPNRMRQVPDAAADADSTTGFAFYCTAQQSAKGCNGWGNTGGDSATGPLWTGATALVNQYLAQHLKRLKGGPFALRAPEDLYTLARAYQAGKVTLPPFNDVTQGDNYYYKAKPGYDLTTGLGSPNFYNIALDLEQLYKAHEMPSAQ